MIDKPYRFSMVVLFVLGYAPVIIIFKPLDVPFAIEFTRYTSEAFCRSDLQRLMPLACRVGAEYLSHLTSTVLLYGLYSMLLVVAAAALYVAPRRPVGSAFRSFVWRYGLGLMASLLFIEVLGWISATRVESFGQLALADAAGREITRLVVWVGMHTWIPAYLIWIWPEPSQVRRWLLKVRS